VFLSVLTDPYIKLRSVDKWIPNVSSLGYNKMSALIRFVTECGQACVFAVVQVFAVLKQGSSESLSSVVILSKWSYTKLMKVCLNIS
jgi:hypothetical protein